PSGARVQRNASAEDIGRAAVRIVVGHAARAARSVVELLRKFRELPLVFVVLAGSREGDSPSGRHDDAACHDFNLAFVYLTGLQRLHTVVRGVGPPGFAFGQGEGAMGGGGDARRVASRWR